MKKDPKLSPEVRALIIKSISSHNPYEVHGFFGDYRFLSNFHQCDISYKGIRYHSTEAAYQAAKTDSREEKLKLAGMKPADVRKAGRLVTMRSDWEEIKLAVMYDVNAIKFTKHPILTDLLVKTGERHLEETNYWGDTFWGVCNGIGHNHLGLILMLIRSNIISGQLINTDFQ